MSDKDVTEVLPPDADGIAKAARKLESGMLVAVPTETVYGLAARADSAEAVARIYAAKQRPSFNPLIVHVHNLEQAQGLARLDARALELAERFWPGPLTLVLPLQEDANVTAAVTAGLPTIALRQPSHKVMRALLAATGFPLAAPSANRSEEISPTRPEHVVESLKDACPLVLDGGPCSKGLESTIVALRDDGDIGAGNACRRNGNCGTGTAGAALFARQAFAIECGRGGRRRILHRVRRDCG